MPQKTIDIKAKKESEKVYIEIISDSDVVSSKINANKITTILEAVEWFVVQPLKTREASDIQKRVTYTYHNEQTPEGDILVIDSIDNIQHLPKDQGVIDFESLPGWVSWTGQEASDWIETNVTNLDSAKNVLQQMAKAIIALRNINID